MIEKGKSSRSAATETRAIKNVQINYIRKKRFSKAQKEILHNVFGALLLALLMIELSVFMLIVG